MQTSGDGLAGVWRQLRTNLKARARLRRQQTKKARERQLKYVTLEQLAYADILGLGVTIGRYFLACTFLLYVFSITAPKIPLSELPVYWSMPVNRYLTSAGVGSGWSWLKLVGYGDYMNFLGIAFLAAMTIVCYLRVLPFSIRRKDSSFNTIVILQILVQLLAASGLLAAIH